ncbi:uncharacterized protein LOC131065816 [Cryptomeria japonica]|uniref:uncharacterized protein LOC131065816 n=1 Tax=Cryptomeria japonica TaxID=3369 RepID=UPI0025ACECA5|nr:uncharacterized protein LOC131065816 [Cryptomeria japonica]
MAYNKMPFGLSNAGATFQKVFERCREYSVSLNPKKTIFTIHEGKLLGYIVSKHGISIEPERITVILALPLPAHKKGLRTFIGRINFTRRFIPNIAALMQPLIAMLKKNILFQWTKEVKDFFLSKDINDKREGWIIKAMEYDISIKVTKLVRGKDLCEQLVGNAKDSKEEEQQVEIVLNNDEEPAIPAILATWNQQIVDYQQIGDCLEGLNKSKRRNRFSFQNYQVCGLKWAPTRIELSIPIITHRVTLINCQTSGTITSTVPYIVTQ